MTHSCQSPKENCEKRDRIPAADRVCIEEAVFAITSNRRLQRSFRKDPKATVSSVLGDQKEDLAEQYMDRIIRRIMTGLRSELWEVENRSRWRIAVREVCDEDGATDDLILAPLERRITNVHPRELYPIRALVRHHVLGVRPHQRQHLGAAVWEWLLLFFLVVPVAYGLSALFFGSGARSWVGLGIAALATSVFGIAAAVMYVRSSRRERKVSIRGPGDPEGYEDTLVEAPTRSDASIRLLQRSSLCSIVALTVVGPSLALYFGTDLSTYVSFAPDGFRLLGDRQLAQQQVVGRVIQLIYIAVVSSFPAMLFFLFDRQRLSSLRESWIRHLFHLHPRLWTVSQIEAAYGSRLNEAFSGGRMTGRLLGGHRSPIFAATMLLTLGWVLIMLETTVVGSSGTAFIELLNPQPAIITFAFLGAYFFAVQLLLRGYIRGDLRPKLYTTITIRVLVVVVVAFLIQETWPGAGSGSVSENFLRGLAFFAGVVPDTMLRRFGDKLFNRTSLFPLDVGRELDGRRLALSRISGMDIYVRTKLFNEGIHNVETLAHTDLIDLIVRTRFPVAQLVDWIDQALLILHTPRLAEVDNRGSSPAGDDPATPQLPQSDARRSSPAGDDSVTSQLEKLAIRTATELIGAVEAGEGQRQAVVDAFAAANTEKPGNAENALTNTVRSIRGEPALSRIENWRASSIAGLGEEAPHVLPLAPGYCKNAFIWSTDAATGDGELPLATVAFMAPTDNEGDERPEEREETEAA